MRLCGRTAPIGLAFAEVRGRSARSRLTGTRHPGWNRPEILLHTLLWLLLLTSCATPDRTGATSQDPDEPTRNRVATGAKGTVSVIGVGDIMLGSNYPSADYLPPNRGRDLMKEVEPILRDADVTFGNLEGAILDAGPTTKNCSRCYAFRSPEYLADNLVTAGFDVMSLANNHSRDFGQRGVESTLAALKKRSIRAAGLENGHESVRFESGGIRFGFAAFAPNIGTVKITDLPRARAIVRDLDANSDIVIVSFHGGAEGADYQHVPRRTEMFYGENRGDVHAFAHAVIDAGADIVFGHGPHVTRAVELYKDRFIAYSLGNFCTYGQFSVQGETGVAPIMRVEVDPSGRFVAGTITPIVQIKNDRVKIDPNKRAIASVQRLTRADGFDGNLRITDDGRILKE